MFRSFGWPEAVIILVVVLIIFGAGKLPQIGGAIGKSIREFRKARGGEVEEGKEKAVSQGSTTPKEIAESGKGKES